MRLTNKYPKETLRLAQRLINKEPINRVAQEEDNYSAKDDALQHAKSYWFMGMAWEEIEALLEDMGFSPQIVNSVIKQTQEYAHETLNQGPFKSLREGQLIRLNNKDVYPLIRRSANHVVVGMEPEKELEVKANQIDFDTSRLLRKAYLLRKVAHKIYVQSQKKLKGPTTSITLPGAPMAAPDQPNMPETFKERTTPTRRAPHDYGEFIPEKFMDVKEVDKAAQQALNRVEALGQDIDNIQSEVDLAKEMMKEAQEKLKKKQIKRTEIMQSIYSTLSNEQQTLANLEDVVVRRFKEKLVAVRAQVLSTPVPAGPIEEMNYVLDFLKNKFPKIAEEVDKEIELFRMANDTIEEKLQKEFAIIEPGKTRMGYRVDAQVWTKVKNWFKGVWDSVKNAIFGIEQNIDEVEEGIDIMDQFLVASETGRTARRVSQAMRLARRR